MSVCWRSCGSSPTRAPSEHRRNAAETEPASGGCDRRDRRRSVALGALCGGGDVATRQREHDLAADAGGGFVAAVAEDDDAQPLLRDHADIGRGVVEAA